MIAARALSKLRSSSLSLFGFDCKKIVQIKTSQRGLMCSSKRAFSHSCSPEKLRSWMLDAIELRSSGCGLICLFCLTLEHLLMPSASTASIRLIKACNMTSNLLDDSWAVP